MLSQSEVTKSNYRIQWWIYGAQETHHPGQNYILHFHVVFGKTWSNSRLAPPRVGAYLGNRGSVTAESDWARHSSIKYRRHPCLFEVFL